MCSLAILTTCPVIGFGQQNVEITSSNLPIILIDTEGRSIIDDPRTTARMRIIDNPGTVRNYPGDFPNNYDGMIRIEIRGKSSQMFPKKSYGFETQDERRNNLNISLLGMPEENDWILYAPYSDKSLLRNVICFDLTRKMGWYASRTKFCELLLNGSYRGIYVLMEKIKRDNNRVAISKLKPEDLTGDELTGGYIFSVDKMEGDYDGWYSAIDPPGSNWRTIFFQYYYPKYNVIVAEQKTYIENFVNRFEETLNGTNFREPDTGYRKYININSFIDFFIIYEFAKEIDSYKFSVYMHKDKDSKGGKLTMGPVWDFNLSFGNVDFGGEGAMFPEDWMYNKGVPRMYWWNRLMEDKYFQDKLKVRWSDLRKEIFDTDSIMNFIDTQTLYIEEARKRNFQCWPVIGQYIWPNFYVGDSYEDEMNYLKDWIRDRLDWMDDNMPGEITSTGDETSISETKTFPVVTYPNPLLSGNKFTFTIDYPQQIYLDIYNILGQKIITIIDPAKNRDTHRIDWTARDRNGYMLPNGLYLFSVKSYTTQIAKGKIIIMR